MSEIVNVTIDVIEPNPFRLLDKYPYVERKLEALKRSIADVGLWEGVIARKAKKGYALAFGHHRVEAARQNGLKRIPLVVRELTDEQMLQFMGRENMEDYNADFLVMLETWEAGRNFYGRTRPDKYQPIDVARTLGWTRGADGPGDRMNHTAQACHAAHSLLAGGFIARSDLTGLTVRDANDIIGRAHTRMEQTERLGSQAQRPRREIEQTKRDISRAVKQTARDVREGTLARKDMRGKVDVHAMRNMQTGKPTPLFAVFGRAVALNIQRMLADDTSAEKLAEIAKVIGKMTLDEDKACLRMIDFTLAELGERAEGWRRKLSPKGENVVPLKLLRRKA